MLELAVMTAGLQEVSQSQSCTSETLDALGLMGQITELLFPCSHHRHLCTVSQQHPRQSLGTAQAPSAGVVPAFPPLSCWMQKLLKAQWSPPFPAKAITDLRDRKPSLGDPVLSSTQPHSGPISKSHSFCWDTLPSFSISPSFPLLQFNQKSKMEKNHLFSSSVPLQLGSFP